MMRPRKKAASVMSGTRSKLLRLNLVPTKVSLVDAVKALIVVFRAIRALQTQPTAFEIPIPAEVTIDLQKKNRHGDGMEIWIESLLCDLRRHHRKEVIIRLGIQELRLNGSITFWGIAPTA